MTAKRYREHRSGTGFDCSTCHGTGVDQMQEDGACRSCVEGRQTCLTCSNADAVVVTEGGINPLCCACFEESAQLALAGETDDRDIAQVAAECSQLLVRAPMSVVVIHTAGIVDETLERLGDAVAFHGLRFVMDLGAERVEVTSPEGMQRYAALLVKRADARAAQEEGRS